MVYIPSSKVYNEVWQVKDGGNIVFEIYKSDNFYTRYLTSKS